MEYKVIPGFVKYEINEEGVIRNVKTQRTTEPYHVSNKTGPLVHLIDKKAGKNDRVAVLRIVFDLFGTKVKGWDVDPLTIELHGPVIHRDRDASGAIIKAPKKVKGPKAKAKVAKEPKPAKEPKAKDAPAPDKATKEVKVKVAKMSIEAKRKTADRIEAEGGSDASVDALRESASAEEATIIS
jgi:hypothetical protein